MYFNSKDISVWLKLFVPDYSLPQRALPVLAILFKIISPHHFLLYSLFSFVFLHGHTCKEYFFIVVVFPVSLIRT